jgi:hypothetical protein
MLEKNEYITEFSWPGSSIFFYIVSVFFVGMGLYKMFFYDNGESFLSDPINAYVGGDAYNFIINANYANAYFILALIAILLGSTIVVIKAITWSVKSNNIIHSRKNVSEKKTPIFTDLPEL